MINKAVFSYFNPNGYSNTAGFNTFQDSMLSTVYAVKVAKRHFDKVEMVTNDFGYKVLHDKIGLTDIDYKLDLNSINHISKFFWAFGKILAYSIQEEPFLHIDNDVYMWNGIPEELQEKELIFQSKEFLEKPGFGWYNQLKEVWEAAPIRPKVIVDNEINDFAYNCGVCGGNNIEIFKEWRKCSEQYIFSEENQKTFFEDFDKMLIHENLFHEQYFIASLIKSKGLRDKVGVLGEESHLINTPSYKYTHLWGLSKKDHKLMGKLHRRVKRECPELYNRVNELKF